MIDIVEVLIHRYAGRSTNELAASLGRDRKTLRNYPRAGGGGGISPGGPPLTEAEWRSLVCEWFPQLADTWLRQVTACDCPTTRPPNMIPAGTRLAHDQYPDRDAAGKRTRRR